MLHVGHMLQYWWYSCLYSFIYHHIDLYIENKINILTRYRYRTFKPPYCWNFFPNFRNEIIAPLLMLKLLCYFWKFFIEIVKNKSLVMLLSLTIQRYLTWRLSFWKYSWVHSFSTYAKCSEKLTFLVPWYAHSCVRIRG